MMFQRVEEMLELSSASSNTSLFESSGSSLTTLTSLSPISSMSSLSECNSDAFMDTTEDISIELQSTISMAEELQKQATIFYNTITGPIQDDTIKWNCCVFIDDFDKSECTSKIQFWQNPIIYAGFSA